jgi:hypothetical protein
VADRRGGDRGGGVACRPSARRSGTAVKVVLRSRRGTDTLPAFPEIGGWGRVTAGRDRAGRRAGRMGRRGTARLRAVAEPASADARAAPAAAERPAHFAAFDLLRLPGSGTTGWPYRRRRAALESVFAARRLSAPWVLCPSTTDPDTVREWLTWAPVGMAGRVVDVVAEAELRGLAIRPNQTQARYAPAPRTGGAGVPLLSPRGRCMTHVPCGASDKPDPSQPPQGSVSPRQRARPCRPGPLTTRAWRAPRAGRLSSTSGTSGPCGLRCPRTGRRSRAATR